MHDKTQAAVDDLAFMRALVENRPSAQRAFGETYLAGGLLYGGQMILHAGQALGWIATTPPLVLAVSFGPTVVFLIVLVWILQRHKAKSRPAPADRAIQTVFAVTGLANLALIAVIGSVALRHHSVATWLIYPCAVFVLQGGAWLVAFALRRHAWLGLVGAGWFAAGIAMGFFVDQIGYFILIAGVAFVLLMAAPGAILIALARRSSTAA